MKTQTQQQPVYTVTASRQQPDWYWIHPSNKLPAHGDLCRGRTEANAKAARLNRKLKGHQR